MRSSAHRKRVLVEAKQRWNCLLAACVLSIFTFPGVEGNSSSSMTLIIILCPTRPPLKDLQVLSLYLSLFVSFPSALQSVFVDRNASRAEEIFLFLFLLSVSAPAKKRSVGEATHK
ncbi:unnamed protein product [Musa hybrid cultivar]